MYLAALNGHEECLTFLLEARARVDTVMQVRMMSLRRLLSHACDAMLCS